MHKTFVLHDESVNTYGFRMLTSGVNLEIFRANPIMLYNHDDWALPIGRWDNIRVEGGQILADAVFDVSDPRAQQIAAKVAGGFIRMASIGAWAPEATSDDPALKLPGQRGATVTKWTVREASIVAIGANHNAIALYDRSTSERLDLSDEATLIRLMDGGTLTPQAPQISETQPLNLTDMQLTQVLGLADKASPEEQLQAAEALKAQATLLADENKALKAELAAHKAQAAERQKQEAVALIDAAIADGRISASGRETYLALFDADFDSAASALAAIPKRRSVKETIQAQSAPQGPSLADVEQLSWDELHRRNLLAGLRDTQPELFKAKFRERYGREWSN